MKYYHFGVLFIIGVTGYTAFLFVDRSFQDHTDCERHLEGWHMSKLVQKKVYENCLEMDYKERTDFWLVYGGPIILAGICTPLVLHIVYLTKKAYERDRKGYAS